MTTKELKNVRLLTAAIVSCLHVNQAVPEGTVFDPEEFGTEGVNEANYLVLHKMAERTADDTTFKGVTLDEGKSHVSGIVDNDDDALKLVLKGSVAEVTEHINSNVYTVAQIKRLGELNIDAEKPRDGVAKAVEAFLAEHAE